MGAWSALSVSGKTRHTKLDSAFFGIGRSQKCWDTSQKVSEKAKVPRIQLIEMEVPRVEHNEVSSY